MPEFSLPKTYDFADTEQKTVPMVGGIGLFQTDQ